MRSSTVFPPPRTARGQDADAPRGRSDDECAAAAPGGSRPFVASGRAKQSPSVVERRSPLETTKHGSLGAFPELLGSSSPTPATGFDLKILSAARSPLLRVLLFNRYTWARVGSVTVIRFICVTAEHSCVHSCVFVFWGPRPRPPDRAGGGPLTENSISLRLAKTLRPTCLT